MCRVSFLIHVVCEGPSIHTYVGGAILMCLSELCSLCSLSYSEIEIMMKNSEEQLDHLVLPLDKDYNQTLQSVLCIYMLCAKYGLGQSVDCPVQSTD